MYPSNINIARPVQFVLDSVAFANILKTYMGVELLGNDKVLIILLVFEPAKYSKPNSLPLRYHLRVSTKVNCERFRPSAGKAALATLVRLLSSVSAEVH